MQAIEEPSQLLRVFISYNRGDEEVAASLAHLLRKQSIIEPFVYAEKKGADDWSERLYSILRQCHAVVALFGEEVGTVQSEELKWHIDTGRTELGQLTVYAILPNGAIPDHLRLARDVDPIRCSDTEDQVECIARETSIRLTGAWLPNDGVPLGYLFASEKRIVDAYGDGTLESPRRMDLLERGCPRKWPTVVKLDAHRSNTNEIQQQTGDFGAEDSKIIVTAQASGAATQLALPEARPRRHHRYPLRGRGPLKVGIVVSGGIAPGINAVIHGIVKRHELYHSSPSDNRPYYLEILGYQGGLQSLISGHRTALGPGRPQVELDRQAQMGGSLLATARWDHFVDAPAASRDQLAASIVSQLADHAIDILYVIGGDGSMRAAHAIWKKAQEGVRGMYHGEPLSVVGIPKTVDNDILWVWQSFGFLSAVEKAREEILNMHTEAKSNPRLCILQLFGSDSGFVASHAGLASGICDAVLIPEVDYTMEGLFDHLRGRLERRYVNHAAYGLVLMGETALPCDALRYIDGLDQPGVKPASEELRVRLTDKQKAAVARFFEEGRRVRGQTPDHLRKGGLEIVSGVLERMIKKNIEPEMFWQDFRVVTNEPRHLIRSVRPSTTDVIFAERLGTLAVDNAMAGYTDFMVSQWLTEYILVPLELAILGRKRVPPSGIFWKSVLASTGQPPEMQ
jgi:6-phosphofructokinase 1